MPDIYLISYALIIFLVSLFGALRLNRGLGLSPFLFTVLGFVIFNCIGAFLIAFGITNTEFLFLKEKHSQALLFHVVNATFLFVLGAWLASRVRIKKFYLKGQQYLLFRQSLMIGMMFFVFLGMAIFFWYISHLNKVPLFHVFSGLNVMQLVRLRDEATSQFVGSYIVVSFGLFYLLPFSSWYFLCKACTDNTTSRKKYFFIFSFIFLLSCFVSIINLQKAPLLIYMSITYLVYIVSANKRISIKHGVYLALIAAGIIGLMYKYFFLAHMSSFSIVKTILLRIFSGQIYPGLAYLDFFPNIHPYLKGAGLPGVWALVADHRFFTSNEIWSHYYAADYKAFGMQGTYNTVFFMQLYAEFGYIGMYVISIITGFMVMLISKFLQAFDFRELAVPLNFLFVRQFLKLSMTDFTIAFCGTDFLLLIGMVLLVLIVASLIAHGFSTNFIVKVDYDKS